MDGYDERTGLPKNQGYLECALPKYLQISFEHNGVEPDTVFNGRASAILAKMLVNAQSIACAF